MCSVFCTLCLVLCCLVTGIKFRIALVGQSTKLKELNTKYEARSSKLGSQFAAVFLGSGDVKVISTRRFLALFAKVVLGATGFAAPMPFA